MTRTLRITGVRDDGYHLIDAEMVELELADELTIRPDAEGLDASGPFADGVPLDDSNLVAKALRLAGRRAHVHLHKVIPHGGGLGGGSADAAAVLRWAGFDDLLAASRLGADIPFCVRGGRARVRGIGEVLEPLRRSRSISRSSMPPLAVSTPANVPGVGRARWPPRPDGPNDLEPAAIAVVPELAA
ncbi:MAG: 4-(cytidine 5'-diphospho)-2-C-methyl-D-erythritol kinase [Ilumatobacteraceae bacterium]